MGDLFVLALEGQITGMCKTPSRNMNLYGNKVGEWEKKKQSMIYVIYMLSLGTKYGCSDK